MAGTLRAALVHWKSILTKPHYRQLQLQCWRLSRYRRYQPFVTQLWGNVWEGADAASFLAAFDEIFVNEIYDFRPQNTSPLILDCGGNIGVSALFYLRRFPDARVRVFEPDPVIFGYLEKNLARWLGSGRLQLDQRAAFTHNDGVCFKSEGADAGHIVGLQSLGSETRPLQWLPSVRLKELLTQPVDFLKLDVEGAEYDILVDCAKELAQVRSCFVELHGRFSEVSRFGEAIDILEKAGFRIQIHVPFAQRRPYAEHTLNQEMELQLNVYGWRP